MTLKIAHRGASGHAPENTLSSFRKALKLKADMVELDVQLTKDKKLVVIHDEKVDRLTNNQGKVNSFTLAEIKKLKVKNKETIPTLEEVLDLINKKTKVNIELKAKNTAQPVSTLINHYLKNKNWNHNNFLVSSFNYPELKRFHRLNPKIKIGILFKRFPQLNLDRAKQLKAYSLNPSVKQTTKKLITQAHQNKLKVFVWTANTKKEIERLKKLGVDGIFSNYPERI